jgi:hypothetical protein
MHSTNSVIEHYINPEHYSNTGNVCTSTLLDTFLTQLYCISWKEETEDPTTVGYHREKA